MHKSLVDDFFDHVEPDSCNIFHSFQYRKRGSIVSIVRRHRRNASQRRFYRLLAKALKRIYQTAMDRTNERNSLEKQNDLIEHVNNGSEQGRKADLSPLTSTSATLREVFKFMNNNLNRALSGVVLVISVPRQEYLELLDENDVWNVFQLEPFLAAQKTLARDRRDESGLDYRSVGAQFETTFRRDVTPWTVGRVLVSPKTTFNSLKSKVLRYLTLSNVSRVLVPLPVRSWGFLECPLDIDTRFAKTGIPHPLKSEENYGQVAILRSAWLHIFHFLSDNPTMAFDEFYERFLNGFEAIVSKMIMHVLECWKVEIERRVGEEDDNQRIRRECLDREDARDFFYGLVMNSHRLSEDDAIKRRMMCQTRYCRVQSYDLVYRSKSNWACMPFDPRRFQLDVNVIRRVLCGPGVKVHQDL